MNWDDVYLVTDKLDLISDSSIDELEKRLGVTMPHGYREFMTRLGEGYYCGYVYVVPPDSVESYADKWRSLDNKRFPWQEDILTPEQVNQSIEIASTLDGDSFAFIPNEPTKIYILPRQNNKIYLAGSNLEAALDWLFTSDVLVSATDDFRYFESEVNRKLIKMVLDIKAKTFRELSEFLFGLNLHQHKYIYEGDDVDFFELFIKPIQGRLGVIVIPEHEIQLIINFDADEENNPILLTLLDKLKIFGFQLTEKNTTIS
jgi:hypothetical protein